MDTDLEVDDPQSSRSAGQAKLTERETSWHQLVFEICILSDTPVEAHLHTKV
jgi:hypothetical protein